MKRPGFKLFNLQLLIRTKVCDVSIFISHEIMSIFFFFGFATDSSFYDVKMSVSGMFQEVVHQFNITHTSLEENDAIFFTVYIEKFDFLIDQVTIAFESRVDRYLCEISFFDTMRDEKVFVSEKNWAAQISSAKQGEVDTLSKKAILSDQSSSSSRPSFSLSNFCFSFISLSIYCSKFIVSWLSSLF